MNEKQILNVSPLLMPIYTRKLGIYCSGYLGNDIYYLKEFVDIFINEIGENKVVEMLKNDNSENSKRCNLIGDNWDNFKSKMLKFDILLGKAKGFYDKIENKKFTKVTEKDVKEFMRLVKKIPLIKQDLYTIMIFLIKNTTLQRMSIPPDAFKILEHLGMKKMDLTKPKPFQNSEVTIENDEKS